MKSSAPNRWMLIAGLALAVLVGAATARAMGTKAEEKRRQIFADAEQQRKKLGLSDRARLYASYPTPELALAKEWNPLVLAPGAHATFKLSGAFPKDAALVLGNDSVALNAPKLTATQLSGELVASKDALPGNVSLAIFTPVSAAEVDLRVAQIQGQFELSVKFDDGTRAVLHPQQFDDLKESCTVDWYEHGSKTITRSGNGDIAFDNSGARVTLVPSEEEMKATQEHGADAVKIYTDPDMQKRMEATGKEMMACTKLGQSEMQECMQKIGKESEVLQKEMKDKSDTARAAYEKIRPHGAFTCLSWVLKGSAADLSGEASCSDSSRMKLTGAARYLGTIYQ